MSALIKTTNTLIDSTTGEVLTTEVYYKEKVEAKKFIQVYLEDFSSLIQLKSPNEIRLMACIWRDSTYVDNEGLNTITMVKVVKEKWAQECEISLDQVNNMITKFVSRRLLMRIGTAAYTLNPNYFFKGPLKSRAKSIKIYREYEIIESKDKP